MRKSLAISKKAADAARKSANAAEKSLSDYERPWIFLERIKVTRREPPPIPNSWFIGFSLKNIGRTPAIIEDCIVRIEDIDTLPEFPSYENAFPLACNHTVAANIEFETSEIGKSPEGGMKNGKPINYVVFGRLTYKELNGKVHHTGFAVEVSPHLPAATGFRNKNYTYYD